MLNSDKHGHFGSIYEYQCFHDDHDDVMQRKEFPHLLPFGKPRASGYKRPVTWSSSVLFDQTPDEQTVELTMIWKAVALTWRHINTYFFFDYRTSLLKCQTKSYVTSHVNVELKGHTCRGSSFIWPICSAETSALSWRHPFWGGTVGTGGCYDDNTVPLGTSKHPTDSGAHISNHNETGQFKDSQFLYTIVSKNINTLKLTAHLSL